MRVIFKKEYKYAMDGCNVSTFAEGATYDLSEKLASLCVDRGVATVFQPVQKKKDVVVSEDKNSKKPAKKKPAKKEKSLNLAPKNKAVATSPQDKTTKEKTDKDETEKENNN